MNTTDASRSPEPRRPWYHIGGPILALAAIVVVVGLAVLWSGRGGDDDSVDLATDTDQTASTTTIAPGPATPGPTVVDGDEPSPPVTGTDDTSPQTTIPPGGGAGPFASDWLYPLAFDPNATFYCDPQSLVAHLWVEQLGLRAPEFGERREIDSSSAELDVKARGEGGRVLDDRVSTVIVRQANVEADLGCQPFAVVTIFTPDAVIDAPVDGPVSSPLVVAGRGTGFEATIDVEFRTRDFEILHQDFVMAGNFGVPEHFAKSFSLPPSDTSGLVIIVRPSGAADGEELPMSMVMVAYEPDGGGWGSIAAVTGVAADDVLNIRQAPNAGAEIVGTIPPDATDVVLTGAVDGGWVTVVHDGVVGWANATFLS